ncbi:MAG: type VI secretion system-associated protein TagF [Pseudomonadota bacterium]
MAGETGTTGFFGKVPAVGDFVSWQLPPSFTDRWDRWMSGGLAEAPSVGALDPRAWHFTVKRRLFGDAPVAGVWRMSEDRIGRRYPFVIVRLGPQPTADDPWFDACARLVRSSLEQAYEPARIADEITRLPEPGRYLGPEAGEAIRFWLDDWEALELEFHDGMDLARRGLPDMRAERPEPADAPPPMDDEA